MPELTATAVLEERDISSNQLPLPFTVSEAGHDFMALHSLLRQAVPMLENTEDFLPAHCQRLAQAIRTTLEPGEPEEEDTADEEEDEEYLEADYEPGCGEEEGNSIW